MQGLQQTVFGGNDRYEEVDDEKEGKKGKAVNVFKYAEKEEKVYNTALWKGITKTEVCRDGIVLKKDKMVVEIETPAEHGVMYVIEEAIVDKVLEYEADGVLPEAITNLLAKYEGSIAGICREPDKLDCLMSSMKRELICWFSNHQRA